MPYYRYERSDPFRDNRNERLITEGEVVELPEEIAEPQPGFVEVDPPESASDREGLNAEFGVEEATDDYVNGHSDVEQLEDDLEEAVGDAMEQAENLADEHWRTVKSAVEDGEADGFLDELYQVDERGSVQEAIEERRSEIEA